MSGGSTPAVGAPLERQVRPLVERLLTAGCDGDAIHCWKLCVEAGDEIDRLRAVLAGLAALVRGECPALLDEDRGGDARLDIAIDDCLRPNA